MARDLTNEIAPAGSGDFMTLFGDRYPVQVLLSSLGLPIDDGLVLVERVRRRPACVRRVTSRERRRRGAKELVAAVREWHRAVPSYRLDTDEPLLAVGGQIALITMPLTWR